MMTRKDYVKIAKAINGSTAIYSDLTLSIETVLKNYLISELCVIFKEDNPNFDNSRFIKACNEEG